MATAPHFFVTLLHSVTQAHLLHLKTRSYAAHKAMGELYEGLPDLADKLIETYQGCTGKLVESYPTITVNPAKEELGFVEALHSYVEDNRKCLGDESQLQNIVDEILALLGGTLYKLRFLA